MERLVWRTCPILDEPSTSDWARLDGKDLTRAAAITHPAVRTRFVVGRVLLHDTIALLRPDLERRAPEIRTTGSGRPYVPGDSVSGGAELWISLSHTRGLAAAAASSIGAVGIDVELASREDLPPVRAWLTEDEGRRLATLPPCEAVPWLLRVWVAKEAAIKAADGDGPIARRTVEVRGEAGADVLATCVQGETAGASTAMDLRWHTVDRFVVAIAAPHRVG